MELQNLNNEELKMIASAITAKLKRLRGSIINNKRNMNNENIPETVTRIAKRTIQIEDYTALKAKVETNIKNDEI
jgi:hypothetical protein